MRSFLRLLTGILSLAACTSVGMAAAAEPGSVPSFVGRRASAGSPADGPLPVVCPAIAADDYVPVFGKGTLPGPIVLVVVGKLERAAKDKGAATLVVEKCLYGDPSIKSLPDMSVGRDERTGDASRGIYVLGHGSRRRATGLSIRHQYGMEEEKWQTALAAARFDLAVLSSKYVFVGRIARKARADGERELSPQEEPDLEPGSDVLSRRIDVVRPLRGADLKAGYRLSVQGLETASSRVTEGEAVYVVDLDDQSRRTQATSPDEIEERPYRLVAAYPLSREAAVKEAIAREKDYPIVDGGRNSLRLRDLDREERREDAFRSMHTGGRCREIVYRGPIEEAVDMLGSQGMGAALLGARTLLVREKEGRAKLMAMLDATLLAEREGGYGQSRRLHEGIRVLGEMDRPRGDNGVYSLVEKVLSHIDARRLKEAAPPRPEEARLRRHWGYRGEPVAADVPRVLEWLLEALTQEEAVTRYGRRLVALRPFAPSPWREAIDEAIDAQAIDECLELSEGWQRMRGREPLASHPQPWHVDTVEEIAFSSDGKWMLVAGDFGQAVVFSTVDWSVARHASYQNSYPRFHFTPRSDALQLTFVDKISELPLAGGGPERPWKLPKLESHDCLRTTADGRYVVFHRGYEDAIDVWDMIGGKRVQTIATPPYGTEHLVAATTGLVVHKTPRGFAVVRVSAGVRDRPLLTGDAEVASAALSPDERFLLTTSAVRRRSDGLSPAPLPGANDDDIFGSDGPSGDTLPTAATLPALGPRGGDAPAAKPNAAGLKLWDLAERKLLASADWPDGDATMHFSANGKTVAVVGSQKKVRLRVFSLPQLNLLGELAWTGSDDGYHRYRAAWAGNTCGSVAVSPDDRQLAVASGRRGIVIYSLPEIKQTKKLAVSPSWAEGRGEARVVFSPDGKWLVATGGGVAGPRWFRTRDWQEVRPQPGHASQAVDIAFAADGKTLVSLAADGSICRWDAASMREQRRLDTPAGYRAHGLLRRGDALLLRLQPDASRSDERPREAETPPQRPSIVERLYDLEKRQFVGQHVLPDEGGVAWLGDDVYLWTRGKRWQRVQAGAGKVLDKGVFQFTRDCFAEGEMNCEVSADRTRLWAIHGLGGDPRGLSELTLGIFDAQTMKQLKVVSLDSTHWSNDPLTLVPGGKYFTIGQQVFDAKSFKFLHDRGLAGCHFNFIAFSDDGERYAAVSYGRTFVENAPPGWDAHDNGLIQVHETGSGRLAAMLPLGSRWGRAAALAFSPDGRRLAVAESDGRIKIWSLP